MLCKIILNKIILNKMLYFHGNFLNFSKLVLIYIKTSLELKKKIYNIY